LPVQLTIVTGSNKKCGNCSKKLKPGERAVILKKRKRKWYCMSCADEKNII